MNRIDLLLLKSALERISDLIKATNTAGGGGSEASFPLSSTTDSSVRPFSTETKTGVGGSKKIRIPKKDYRYKDYAYGQRGKNEAGKTKPGVTGLPAEPTQVINIERIWNEHGTPYRY